MLDRDQRRTLISFLLSVLPGNPGPAQIEIYVGAEIAHGLPALPRTSDVANWIIDQALAQPSPAIMVKVIRTVDNGSGSLASIVQLATSLEADDTPWIEWRERAGAGDPLQVQDGRPFIDRSLFRDYLPQLNESDTPNCIVVEGDTGSGKTYLHEYLKELAARRRSFEVGFTAIGASNARSMTPLIAATDLALGLKTNFQQQPRQHEDPHRLARNLVAWIAEFTPERVAPSVAVFDGFDADGVTDPMHTFIQELVHTIQEDEATRKRIQVVLLGYDVARLEEKNLRYKRYTLEYVDHEHIEDWLKQRFPGRPGYVYEETASSIIERLPPSEDLRLHQLCGLVQVAMAQFGEQT